MSPPNKNKQVKILAKKLVKILRDLHPKHNNILSESTLFALRNLINWWINDPIIESKIEVLSPSPPLLPSYLSSSLPSSIRDRLPMDWWREQP